LGFTPASIAEAAVLAIASAMSTDFAMGWIAFGLSCRPALPSCRGR
jgi:hypothetical protein